MDSNGDGLVSKEEFDAAAQKEIADKKVDTPEKLEKFNKFMAYTWENGDVNHDNYLSPEEFAAQRQRNREKFSRKIINKRPLEGLFIYALNRHEHSGILNTFTISLFLRLTLICKTVRPTASATQRSRWPNLTAPVSSSQETIFCP